MVKGYVAVVAGLSLLLAACSQGAYPSDIFPEMHHQPSQRRLEPSRAPAPAGAVATSGGHVAYTFDQAAGLRNPLPEGPQSRQQARALYATNCAMCHGEEGRGDGVVANYFRQSGAVPPPDFGSERVRARTDGQLWWLISNGIGGMPAFRGLLTDDQRWLAVYAVHELDGS